MTENRPKAEVTAITVADEQHPLTHIKTFFSKKNNILNSVGFSLIILYFFFAYGTVESALVNASGMIRDNRGIAKEYKNVRQSEMLVLSKLDSLDKNKFDKILLDSISFLKDTVQFHKNRNILYTENLTKVREKLINTKEDLTIMRADMQNRVIEVEQLKAQQQYNEKYYRSLSTIKDSLEAENYKLRIQVQTLKAQLTATTTVKQ